MFLGTVRSTAASMLTVSGLAVFSCDLVGVLGTFKQQTNDMKFFTKPHTIVEVATRPPTLAHNRIRNWKNPSLKKKNTLEDISSLFFILPVFCNFHFKSRNVIFKINARSSMGPMRMVNRPHMVLYTILIGRLLASQSRYFCRDYLNKILEIHQV